MARIHEDLELIEKFGDKQYLRCCRGEVDWEDCINFEFQGVNIVNPFLNVGGTKRVNPIKHYGINFINSDFVKLLKNMELFYMMLEDV